MNAHTAFRTVAFVLLAFVCLWFVALAEFWFVRWPNLTRLAVPDEPLVSAVEDLELLYPAPCQLTDVGFVEFVGRVRNKGIRSVYRVAVRATITDREKNVVNTTSRQVDSDRIAPGNSSSYYIAVADLAGQTYQCFAVVDEAYYQRSPND